MGHSEDRLKLGHSCLKGKDLCFPLPPAEFRQGVGRFAGIFLKEVFSLIEWNIRSFGFEY